MRLINEKKKSKFNKNKTKTIYINYFKVLTLLLLTIVYIKFYFIKFPNKKVKFNNTRQNKTIIKQEFQEFKNDYQYFCCFCAMGKKENLYSRELISYYKSLGVEKFVFGDNNDPNTEKLSDVLQDYINDGTVDILEIYGSTIGQGEFYGIMYEKYKKRCKWLTFFDFDEYLVMHFNKEKNLTLNEFLNNSIYDKCDAIEINWLMHGDNNLVYYDNRTLVERFTKPNFNNYGNRFVKSIIRGNINQVVFKPGATHHQPSLDLKLCDSMGKPASYYPDCIIPPQFDYAYLMHFNTKTAEEYVNKLLRGHPSGFHFDNEIVEKKIDSFFNDNEFSLEKLKIFEEKFNRTFHKYHNRKY